MTKARHQPIEERTRDPGCQGHDGPGTPGRQHEGPAGIQAADDPADDPVRRLASRPTRPCSRMPASRDFGELADGPPGTCRPDPYPRPGQFISQTLDQSV